MIKQKHDSHQWFSWDWMRGLWAHNPESTPLNHLLPCWRMFVAKVSFAEQFWFGSLWDHTYSWVPFSARVCMAGWTWISYLPLGLTDCRETWPQLETREVTGILLVLALIALRRAMISTGVYSECLLTFEGSGLKEVLLLLRESPGQADWGGLELWDSPTLFCFWKKMWSLIFTFEF